MREPQTELEFVNRRFDRDATAFDAIYKDDEHHFFTWFNKNFRKPIYERFDTAFAVMGDLRNKSVIDIGCGSGVYVVNAAKKGAKRVLGVDFSAEMLKLADQKIKTMGCADQCELKQANFLDMTPTEQFDFSLAMGVFDYLPDPVTFLHHLKAVTKEKIIASFPGHSSIREPLRKLRYLLTSRGKVYFYSKEDINRIVQAVGFRQYELVTMKTGSGFVLLASP